LFNSDILHHIYNNFLVYFKAYDVYKYFIAVVVVLLINWLFVKYWCDAKYTSFVPKGSVENKSNEKAAWGILLLSFGLYVLRFVAEEQTVLNNFDSMGPFFINSLQHGSTPVMRGWRFTPLTHIDTIIIYGISNNYFIIGCWCILKQILVLYFLYKCFNFIPKTRRLYLVGLINFIPAVFCVNNIVFPEQNVIIFILLSLIGLDKFQKTGSARYLLLFLLCMNCAIYTKETSILLYASYGLYLLYDGFREGRISFALIKRPWKQLRKMPIEWLMFVSMLIWLLFYCRATADIADNRYLKTHASPMLQMLGVYAVELIVTVMALFLLGRKIYKKQFSDMCMFMESSVIGSVVLVWYIICWLKIVPTQDFPESYYVYLPAVFCTIYVFENIKQVSTQRYLALLLVLLSLYQNWNCLVNMDGDARHDLMDFIETKAPKLQDKSKKPMTLYFYSSNLMVDTVFWRTTGWIASFRSMLTDRNILVKMDKFYERFINSAYAIYPISFDTVARGDYIVINRKSDPDLQGTNNLVYRNRVYDVYGTN
ncbi:MAG: hypothetical protein J6T72_02170, partial [Alphaproteobacteria bacterium]|nr:hypothetical protein [Alphaproteobacteria bacterium]